MASSSQTVGTSTMSTSTTSAPDPPRQVSFKCDDDNDEMNNDHNPKEEEEKEVPVRAKRPSMSKSVSVRMPQKKHLDKWPRCHACCCGVFIPINIIVTISLISGLLLGKLEMQEEINGNDAYMRLQQADDKFAADLDMVFVEQLPPLCLGLFQQDQNLNALPRIFEEIMTNDTVREFYLQQPETLNGTLADTNKTVEDLALYFSKCGQAGGHFRDYWLGLFTQQEEEASSSLTFNYIRCVNRSSPLAFNAKLFPDKEDIHDVMYSSQADLYAESWKRHQQTLEKKYKQELTELEALTQSYAEATGKEKCAVNMPAAAWFWFTVMSTVGYGNQYPQTVWGRLLTCTVGFVSILMFGATLGTAGSITTHVVNDFVHRFKQDINRLQMIVVWGSLWLLWMLVITHQAMSYLEKRLQQDFDFNDAYWFSFITTTTVGFGDYYLPPEGLFVGDLVGLWANFMIGFVFLSSFLTELSQLLGSIAPDLSGELQRNLKYAYDHGEDSTRSVGTKSTTRLSMKNNSREPESNGWDHPILNRNRENNGPHNYQPRKVSKPRFVVEDDDDDESDDKAKPESAPYVGQEEEKVEEPKPELKNQALPKKELEKPKAQAPQPKQQQPPKAEQATQQKGPPATPTQKHATFSNTGTDPSMAKAELYYQSTRWGPLGHGDADIAVSTYPGDTWYIAANGVFAKMFTIKEDAQQKFFI